MNIDINALQALPEVDAAPTGLLTIGTKCPKRTRVICLPGTCKITIVVVGAHE